MKSAINSFNEGTLSVNELVVLTVVTASATNGRLEASTTDISTSLNGGLSRHAVARALRNLQDANWLSWNTNGGGGGGSRNSVIVVN